MTSESSGTQVAAEVSHASEGEFAALSEALRVFDEVLTVAVDKQARLLGPVLSSIRGEECVLSRLTYSVSAMLAAVPQAFLRAAPLGADLPLSITDLAALLIVLAPDIDLRYERIYAYLQDDITRKRQTLDLIANLPARDAGERLAICARFRETAPLLQFGLLPPHGATDMPSLAWPWHVDELWRQSLLGEDDVSTYIISTYISGETDDK